jgi:hypothetical protein
LGISNSELSVYACSLVPHDAQLIAHYAGVVLQNLDGVVGLSNSRERVSMLLITTVAHFDKHAKVGHSQDQITERKENCGIGGTAVMVPDAPPSIWPYKSLPNHPTNVTKGSIICAIILWCAILLWFGAPLLSSGSIKGQIFCLLEVFYVSSFKRQSGRF